jgi:hypothetical protein
LWILNHEALLSVKSKSFQVKLIGSLFSSVPQFLIGLFEEVTWYALTDKWILAQELRILLRRGNKIPMEGVTETKFKVETGGTTTQRLPYLGHKQP